MNVPFQNISTPQHWCALKDMTLDFDKLDFVNTDLSSSTARKQEIIKITEQLIEAINNGDFEAYA